MEALLSNILCDYLQQQKKSIYIYRLKENGYV